MVDNEILKNISAERKILDQKSVKQIDTNTVKDPNQLLMGYDNLSSSDESHNVENEYFEHLNYSTEDV